MRKGWTVRTSLIAILLLAGAARADNKPDHWVFFESKETGNGPRLELTLRNGSRRSLPVVEDSTLISYLPQGVYGRMPSLSISMGDTNRVLLHFGRVPKAIKRAELVVSMKLSEMAPSEEFKLALFPVAAAWGEHRTSWDKQPAAAKEPVFETKVAPREGVLKWDVTAALKEKAPHGWLLKVLDPVRNLDATLGEVVSWLESTEEARAQAKRERKHVLALVLGSPTGKQRSFTETLFTAVVLADPDVRAVVRERFVPLRIGVRGQAYTLGVGRGNDPLAALGTRLAVAKPPALVVATARGKHVATLQSIGTFSPGLVHRFLAKALGKRGRKPAGRGLGLLRRGEFEKAEEHLAKAAAARGSGQDEARYYLGCLLYRKGRHDEAKQQWRAVGAESLWRWKCAARLAAPTRMAMFEALEEVDDTPKSGTTERARGREIVKRALRWLAAQQQPDGSWVTGHGPDEWQGAVTALSANALLVHGTGEAEVARATEWLRGFMAKTEAEKANAWAAGYTLDFFLERLRREPKFKADAQRAVEFVEGGQCPIGAWSYSRHWGVHKTRIPGWPEMPKGRYHSMNTGPSMVSLLLARDQGLKVSEDVLAKGRAALLDMREEAGVFTYTWPHPRNWNKDPANSIGRAPTCEHALFKLGATKKADLKRTLGYFMKYRANLRRSVKVTASWTMPSAASAYFFHFAYWHAAVGLHELGDKRSLELLRKDLLQCVEADDTWVDWPPYGKHYATAMALLVLAG
ncbi:MAG: hypothetical protein ACYSUM_12290 [Planctomycetota bacterium]|jgi:hypothetical protein